MPYLDVDEVLCDPSICDFFSVVRTAQTTDTNGLVLETKTTINNVVGVVTTANPNDLYREEDFENFSRSLNIITQYRLQGQRQGFEPDIVIWHGNQFVVATFDPYPQFGNGFYEAICTSIDQEDNALDLVINGQLSFNSKTNSSRIICLYR